MDGAEDTVDIAGSRYVDWLIPGIIGMNIMGNSLWGLGFSIVQMRLRKILKRLVASPMRRWEFLLAQILARMLFLVPEVIVPLLFGVLAFGMPLQGSVVDIAVLVPDRRSGVQRPGAASRQPAEDVRSDFRGDESRRCCRCGS